ncbi:MAG TPA: dihydrolipoamide acetyltransferase family protein [Thermoanaerobaculia bacterium]|nr:dihydrolipoamide acetyltransferase family protein [Thermoanaerobaculia bacterium]
MSEIIMPKMGDAMTEGKVIRWYKKAGDPVKKGEPLLEIETDKVNLDLEAEEDGVLGEIVVGEGSMAEVGSTLATIGAEGAAPAKPKGEKPQAPATEEPKEAEATPAPKAEAKPEPKPQAKEEKPAPAPEPARPPQKAAPAAKEDADRRVRSSPLARRVAKELGVDIGGISGSGPQGRVVAEDIRKASGGAQRAPGAAGERAAEAKPVLAAPAGLEKKSIPLSAMRKTIAKRLVESLGPIPHFFLTIDVDVTELTRMREQISEIAGAKLSLNDFIVRAAALALHHHPLVNASFTDAAIEQHGEAHIGIAVATPEGLITPVVRNADRKSVVDIAAEVRDLAGRARNRKLRPDEYQGSTFTISNLGMFGIEEFTAVINPPNVAILAIGAAGPQPVVVDGKIRIRERMKVTMSCDHRVVDGAAGAEYLRTLRTYLEQPLRLVM